MSARKAIVQKKFRTQFNPHYKGAVGSKNTAESMVQPSQNLTVRQLLKNHTRGMGLGVPFKQGIYTEQEVPIFEDITDAVAYKELLEQKLKTVKEDIAAQNKEYREREKQKLREEIAKEEKDAENPLKTPDKEE